VNEKFKLPFREVFLEKFSSSSTHDKSRLVKAASFAFHALFQFVRDCPSRQIHSDCHRSQCDADFATIVGGKFVKMSREIVATSCSTG
jgi:hypothetical protein